MNQNLKKNNLYVEDCSGHCIIFPSQIISLSKLTVNVFFFCYSQGKVNSWLSRFPRTLVLSGRKLIEIQKCLIRNFTHFRKSLNQEIKKTCLQIIRLKSEMWKDKDKHGAHATPLHIYTYIYIYIYAPPWGVELSGEGIAGRRQRNAKLFERIDHSGSR